MKKFLLISILLVSVVKQNFGQAAAGLCSRGIELWYNTDQSEYSTLNYNGGNFITSWDEFPRPGGMKGLGQDVSYPLSSISNDAYRPSKSTSTINSYPIITFGGKDFLFNGSVVGHHIRSSQSMSVYSVVRTTSSPGVLFSHGLGSSSGRLIYTPDTLFWGSGPKGPNSPKNDRLFAFTNPIASDFEIRTTIVSVELSTSGNNTMYMNYINGKWVQTKIVGIEAISNITDSFILGSMSRQVSPVYPNEHKKKKRIDFNGDLVELIVIKDSDDPAIDGHQLIQLTTYLSLKYGISKDNSGGNLTYMNYNLDDLWPYNAQCGSEGTYSNFSTRITGIFRERNCLGTEQVKSTNYDNDAMLTGALTKSGVNTGTFATPAFFDKNRAHFLWGDNNGTNTFLTNGNGTDAPGGLVRMERKWKVRETRGPNSANIDDITFEIDLSGTDIPSSVVDANNLYLLFDTDLDGSFADETALHPTSYNPSTKIAYFTKNFGTCGVFSIAISAAALPVSWASFKAYDQNNQVQLDWVTATELNNSHFEIERSFDGINWKQIGEVSGNGTVVGNSYYSFADKNPEVGYNYYRIKQVDFDGQYAYSKVELVTYTNGVVAQSNIFPNPSNDFITIEIPLNSASVQMQIMDMSGNVVLSDILSQESNVLDISMLNKGVYLVVLHRDNGKMVHRLVVN